MSTKYSPLVKAMVGDEGGISTEAVVRIRLILGQVGVVFAEEDNCRGRQRWLARGRWHYTINFVNL